MKIEHFNDLLSAAKASPCPSPLGEAGQFGKPWALVCVAAMSGARQQPPTTEDAEKPLQSMVESIQRGDIGEYLAFDREALPVQLD